MFCLYTDKRLVIKMCAGSGIVERQHDSFALQKAECEKQLQAAKKNFEKAKDEYTRADERLRGAESETDRVVSKYGIEISRRLDGAYAIDEVEDVKSAKSNEKNKLADAIDQADKNLASIEAEIVSIPQKKADLSLSRSEAEQRCKLVKEALEVIMKKKRR